MRTNPNLPFRKAGFPNFCLPFRKSLFFSEFLPAIPKIAVFSEFLPAIPKIAVFFRISACQSENRCFSEFLLHVFSFRKVTNQK